MVSFSCQVFLWNGCITRYVNIIWSGGLLKKITTVVSTNYYFSIALGKIKHTFPFPKYCSFSLLNNDITGVGRVMVFQLYSGGQFYWWRKLGKTTDLLQVTDKLLSHNVVSSTLRLSGVLTHKTMILLYRIMITFHL